MLNLENQKMARCLKNCYNYKKQYHA